MMINERLEATNVGLVGTASFLGRKYLIRLAADLAGY
jgi:hypothetical protein